jgi:hypothetical protein
MIRKSTHPVHRLASQYRASDLLHAASARCAVELVREHKGHDVPAMAVERTLGMFERMLVTCIDSATPTRGDEEEEDAGA